MASVDYNNNIYNRTNRRTVVEIIYSLMAPDSKDGGVLTLPPGLLFSRPDQIMNDIRDMAAPIATLEANYWKLNGTFVLPGPPEEAGMEVGYWSDAKSNEEGIFDEPLRITRIFENIQRFNSLGITFDPQTDNYCTDFEVWFYGANDELVYHENVTGNIESRYQTEAAGINILRVELAFYKTNRPDRYLRITELDFGVLIKYHGEDVLQNFSIVRDADITGQTLPFPELRIQVLNLGRYDQIDPLSYASYFQTRQKFESFVGLVLPDNNIEWVNCGTFFLKNWKVSDSVVEFTATGKLEFTANTTYFESTFEQRTVAEMVKSIFPEAEINIGSPPIPGYFGNVERRRLLTMLSELSCCLTFENIDNIIIFDDILSRDGEEPIDHINYQNTFGVPSVELADYFNSISLTEYNMSTEYRQVDKSEYSPGDIKIYFDGPIVGEPEFILPDGYTLTNVVVKTMYVTAVLSGSAPVEITTMAERVELAKSEVIYPAPWHTSREADIPYKVDLPCMIRGEGFAEFRDWFIARRFRLINKRLRSDIRWANNPYRKLGDTVNLQLKNIGSNADMVIMKQELNYSGALSGSVYLIADTPDMRIQ